MNDSIKELQKVLLDMLRDIDKLCRENKISYQLFAGSALGAVREKGFIPWDDDLDLAMPRKDYERFLQIAEKELDHNKYFIQKEYSEHFYYFNSKLRLNGTTFMERYIPRDKKMHQGVFVDIFPLDNLSDNTIVAYMQFIASKIVIAKCLTRRGYATESKKKKTFMLFCRLLPLKPFRKFAEKRRYNTSKRIHSFFGGASKYKKNIYSRECLNTINIAFEDGYFPVSAEYDELLTTMYGDYMTPMKESELDSKRHFLKMDLNRPYTDYLDWQEGQVIKKYTKSIR